MRGLIRLLRLLRGYRLRVALGVLLATMTVAANMGLLATAAYLISAAALVQLLIELTIPIYLVRMFGLGRAFARYAERLLSHNVTFRLLGELRVWTFGRLVPLAPAYLSRHRSGDVLARITRDVEELQTVYQQLLSPVLSALSIGALTFVLLRLFSPVLAWTAAAFLVVTGLGVPLLVGQLSRGLGHKELTLRGELEAQLVDGVQGVQDLLAFGRAGDYARCAAATDAQLRRVQSRMAVLGGLEQALGELMPGLALVATLALTIPLVSTGRVGGVFLAFLGLLVLSSFEAVQPLGAAFRVLGRSVAAGRRLYELADTPPAVLDPEAPAPAPSCPALTFEDVSFRYSPGEPEVLRGVSFRLEPHRRIAIVGPSGSGKSTLVNLALRFWDPSHGSVRLGGRDLREYAQADLRAAIGVVSQDTYLFDSTVRDNLRLARPDATEEELWAALNEARLDEFVRGLPEGLDTWVGEHGLRLSGGERQRLGIARTLLEDAPILILDEPTANLDALTEEEVREALYGLMRGRTTLVITHRLVGMEAMDEVLVMDGGRVVERGTHAGLLARGGLYARLLEVQGGMLADLPGRELIAGCGKVA